MSQKTVEDKLYLDRFVADEESHLIIKDPEPCLTCEDHVCTIFCPTDVYKWDEDGAKILVEFEACVECGTCRIGCPYDNIEWRNPRGEFGIQYKYG